MPAPFCKLSKGPLVQVDRLTLYISPELTEMDLLYNTGVRVFVVSRLATERGCLTPKKSNIC